MKLETLEKLNDPERNEYLREVLRTESLVTTLHQVRNLLGVYIMRFQPEGEALKFVTDVVGVCEAQLTARRDTKGSMEYISHCRSSDAKKAYNKIIRKTG